MIRVRYSCSDVAAIGDGEEDDRIEASGAVRFVG